MTSSASCGLRCPEVTVVTATSRSALRASAYALFGDSSVDSSRCFLGWPLGEMVSSRRTLLVAALASGLFPLGVLPFLAPFFAAARPAAGISAAACTVACSGAPVWLGAGAVCCNAARRSRDWRRCLLFFLCFFIPAWVPSELGFTFLLWECTCSVHPASSCMDALSWEDSSIGVRSGAADFSGTGTAAEVSSPVFPGWVRPGTACAEPVGALGFWAFSFLEAFPPRAVLLHDGVALAAPPCCDCGVGALWARAPCVGCVCCVC